MTRTLAFCIIIAALLGGTASSAGALEIDGNFLLGNLGFTPSRASTDATYTGTDYLWGGSLSVRQDFSSSVQVRAAIERDLVTGNTISAMLQYKSDYFRVGMGPWLGLLNSSANILKSGISTLLGVEIPGVIFLTVQTDSSLGGQASTEGDYSAQNNEILLGFRVPGAAICTFGLTYEQFSWTQAGAETVDGLTTYSLDVKVFEKNVPFRLDFYFAYQSLLRQYVLSGVSQGLNSIVAGTGIDFLITSSFALTMDFLVSAATFGTGGLSPLADLAFAPFLFQGSAGFRIVLEDSSAGQP